MSVLSTPRIFFQGKVSWNPATANNNDLWPTFDMTNAELNWDFLATQNPPITPANVRTAFPVWARTPQQVEFPGGPKSCQPPCEWNYFGGSSWWLHTADEPTVITGAQYEIDGPVHTDASDPLMGATLDLVGDSYPGSEFPTQPRMLDNNPDASWSTTFLARGLRVGPKTAPEKLIRGTVVPGTWLSSRWLHYGRNLNLSGKVGGAGVGGSLQQTCLPKEGLRLDADRTSPALKALAAGLRSDDVRGLMIRFTAYLTVYYTDPAFKDLQNASSTERYARLTKLWDEQLASGQMPLQNPAVSRVVGSIGLWKGDETVTVPGGRYLSANTTTQVEVQQKKKQVWLGCAALETSTRAGKRYASMDLTNTVPEVDESCEKVRLGDLKLLLEPTGAGTPRTVGTLAESAYQKAPYEQRAGIVDVELDATEEQLAAGNFVLVRERAGGQDRLLVEQRLTAWCENRGVYVEQGGSGSLTIEVRDRGALPERPVLVLLQQYVPTPPPPAPGDYLKRAEAAEELIAFRREPGLSRTGVVSVRGGRASVTFDSVRPGFPLVAFFPYFADDAQPVPPDSLPPFGQQLNGFMSAFYSTVRVMPFDDALPARFRELLDTTGNNTDAAWEFVYQRVLYLYDAVYPVMRYYGSMDLGDRKTVDRNIDLILQLSAPEMLDSSLYMPASRDLSAGKRTVLKMYRDLLHSGA